MYFLTIRGSLHWRWRALGLRILYSSLKPRSIPGISTHSALWSLGIPASNAKYPPINEGSNHFDTYIPSIVADPLLCVAVGGRFVNSVRALTKFRLSKKLQIQANRTFSLKSVRTMTSSPSSCHSAMSCLRSFKIASHGHSMRPSFASPRQCC